VAEKISEELKERAKKCLECPVCVKAREKQKGLAYWFVKLIDRTICPYCKAFEKVFNQRAYEPITKKQIDSIYKK
jgi:hypothetical protein